MKVVLLKSVNNLGSKGAIIEVTDGYARNFLLPRGVAALKDDLTAKKLQLEIRLAASKITEKRSQEENVSKLLNGRALHITRSANEKGILYSQVSAKDVVSSIKGILGADATQRKLVISNPLKHVGKYQLFYDTGSNRVSFDLVIDAVTKP